ncbi:MAG: metallophosphoesterase family protein [Rhizobiaceae bacterium]
MFAYCVSFQANQVAISRGARVFLKLGSFVAALALSIILTSRLAAADALHSWVQLGPDNELIARVITQSPDCPELLVDGRSIKMSLRAGREALFPENVCERRLPQSSQQISLDGKQLPVPSPDIQRIVVMGDTGCRIRRNRIQDCNNPAAWPIKTIAKEIAVKSPDLIVHVGDYIYRSMACPIPAKCQGSPYGDNFQGWSADWLDPAADLYPIAPFVFLRGNHENCGRGDQGWFRYLAPRTVPVECPAVTEPWSASIDGINLIVFDASDGSSPESNPKLMPEYRRMAMKMFADVSGETWLLTHRPLWANMRAFGELINGDDTQRAAFGYIIPEPVSLIVSGHIHAFQTIDLANGPVQLISGNSGTQLDPMPTSSANDIEVAGSVANTVINDSGFGFVLFTREKAGSWLMDVIDVNGDLRHRCQLVARALSCNLQ